MAAGRANVGSVSVSVVPDATGFSSKLGAQIDPVVAALGQKIGRDVASSIASAIRDAITQGIVQGGATSGAQGSRSGDQYGGSFARALKDRLDAAFRALPDVKIDANSTDVDVKIASIREQLDELSQKRIGIDITEADALEKIGLLHAALEELSTNATSIRVKMDTAAAQAELAKLVAELEAVGADKATVKVDADTSQADAALADTESAAGSASGGFSGLIAAGIALGPALIPVIAAVAAALLGLLSILGAGLLGVGVFLLAVSGVAKGVSELDAQNNKAASSGKAAAGSALAQAGAAQQIQQAEASLANTRASAASAAIRSAEQVKNAKQAEEQAETDWATNVGVAEHAVNVARTASAAATQTAAQNNAAAAATLITSERSLTDAQTAATQAQTDLTAARVTAAQQQQDLANQVIDGLQAQQQATFDVTDARTALTAAQAADPTGTTEAAQKAQLAYDQANQRLTELQVANQRLANQKAASDKAGIDGSGAVVTAQNQANQAQQALIDAQAQVVTSTQNVADTQKAGAATIVAAQQAVLDAVTKVHKEWASGDDAVKKADQAVADALRSQSDQARQSAFSIAQAVNAVAAAHRSASSAALGGVPAISAQANAFNQLSPAVQAFAHFVHDFLEPAFKEIQGSAAAGLLPGVEAAFKTLLPILPGFSKFIGEVAKAIGDLFVQGAKTLKDPFWTRFFDFVSTNAIPALQGIATFLLDVATGFAGLIEAFAPVTGSVGNGILDLAGDFAQFGEQAGTPGSPFQSFIGYVTEFGPQVASFFGDLFGLVGNLITVFTPWGDLLFQIIAYVIHLVTALGPTGLAFVLLGVGAAVLAIANPISVLITAFTAVAGGALYIYQNVKPVHDFIDQHLLPLFHEFADYLINTVWPILKQIGGDALSGIETGIGLVAQAITDHKPELEELYNTFKQAADFIVEHVVPILGPLLKGFFISVGAEVTAFIDVVSGIVDVFDAIPGAATSVWNTISDIFTTGVNDVIDVINFFINALRNIPGVGDILKPISHIGAPSHQSAPPDGSGTGGSGGNRAFARGGVLPGYNPGVDSIRAMLSPGEGILVPEAVALLGPDWVYQINHIASGGRAPLQRFGIGGIVNTIGGGLSAIGGTITGIGSGIANAALGPLIHEAESAAKGVSHHLIDPGFFRDWADGTIDMVGNSLKFAGGGIAAPWSGMAGTSIAGASAGGGSLKQVLTIENNHRPMSPADIVSGWNQHTALHGGHLFAGAGIPGHG